MLSNILMQIGKDVKSELDVGMVRHMALNSIRSYRTKFFREYGELVIACDNKNYWRKRIFPYYKANRKKTHDASKHNWESIFECLGIIRTELKEFFPYRVLDVESAEADDIIGTLARDFGGSDVPVLIVSGDKDFIQLHTFENVKQYDPTRKKWIEHDNPLLFLKEHILKGDSGDGVPNILSPDNCFVVGERQKPLTQKRIDSFMSLEPQEFGSEALVRNFDRNKQLIDLSFTPEEIRGQVRKQFREQSQEKSKRAGLFSYFMNNSLRNLTENIGEF